jgi:hypothetical protein
MTTYGKNYRNTPSDVTQRVPRYPREECQLQKSCGVAPAGLRCLFGGGDRATAGFQPGLSARSWGRVTAGLSTRPRSFSLDVG